MGNDDLRTNPTREREELVSTMLSAYGKPTTGPLVAAYSMGLADLPTEALQLAVVHLLRTSKFLPRVCEIREAINGSDDERAVASWLVAMQTVSRLGPYRHIDFQDRFINGAIRLLGGWPQFCARFTSAEAEKWLRKEFLATYSMISARGYAGESCKALPGLSDAEVIDGEQAAPVPRLVSCPVSCPFPTVDQQAIEATPNTGTVRVTAIGWQDD